MRYLFTLALFAVLQVSIAQTFENLNANLPEVFNSITAFGDADGDGDLDLYLSGVDANNELAGGLYIYDAGSYTLSVTSGLPLLSLGSARWGDINNDGFVDIVILGYDDATFVGVTDVFLNNNDGTFSASNTGLPPSYLGEVALSDINNDGNVDIAITGLETVNFALITKIYKNNGDTTFSELTGAGTFPGMNFGRIKFADYNNNGFQDFVLSGFGDDYYTKIFTNNGDETFTESGIVLLQSWLGDTEWGDYNDDGNMDLIISGTGGASGDERNTILYKNNGDGTFTDIAAGFNGVSHSSIEWGDFDDDGDLDVLIIGTNTTPGDGNYTYHVYNNDGSDAFSLSATALLTGSYYGDADSGDIDNDGKIDLVISGYNENDLPDSNVFVNTTILSVNESQIDNFNIFPNPSIDKKVTIVLDNAVVNMGDVEVFIFAVNGIKVYENEYTSNSEYFRRELDLSNLKTGIYIIKIRSNNIASSNKLIIK